MKSKVLGLFLAMSVLTTGLIAGSDLVIVSFSGVIKKYK